MELVSHTGQGIMHGTGLIPKLKHRSIGPRTGAIHTISDQIRV